ncbi:MAG: glycoside hydrolase [candidate division Zixibacteria bacterium]|nr:glycoside hydrolase [candidate division Zixibacteria bacterium]
MHRVLSTTPRSVMFTLDAPLGSTVSISGSFNDWTPQAMTKGGDGVWRITVQLAPGTYEYRFLVDEEWRDDPNNARKNLNALGGYDSICAVL